MIKDQKFILLDVNRPMAGQLALDIRELTDKGLVVYAALCSRKIVESVARALQTSYVDAEFETRHLRDLVITIDPYPPVTPNVVYTSQDHKTNFGTLYGIALYSEGNDTAPALQLPDYSCVLFARDT